MELFWHLLPSELPRLDLRGVADILIVAGLIYWLLLIIKDTTAVMLVRGLAILVLGGALVSNLFQLPVLGWLIRNSIPALLVAIPILFQPELRRALEHLGHLRGMLPSHVAISNQGQQIEVLADATRVLSQRRWGALLVLERETSLGEYAAKGVAARCSLLGRPHRADLSSQHPPARRRSNRARRARHGSRLPVAPGRERWSRSPARDTPSRRARHHRANRRHCGRRLRGDPSDQLSPSVAAWSVISTRNSSALSSIFYRPTGDDGLSRLLRPTAWRERLTVGGSRPRPPTQAGGRQATRGTLAARVGDWLGRGSSRRRLMTGSAALRSRPSLPGSGAGRGALVGHHHRAESGAQRAFPLVDSGSRWSTRRRPGRDRRSTAGPGPGSRAERHLVAASSHQLPRHRRRCQSWRPVRMSSR